MHILIIEDEKQLCQSIAEGLRMDGYEADTCFDGDEGLELCLVENYDLILLDLNLPGVDGLEILRQFRESNTSTPVLILSARGQIQDKVEGLDLGANDYLTKPFHFEELMARIRVMIRRSHGKVSNQLQIADLILDVNAHTVKRNNNFIELSAKEFAILEYMMQNSGIVLSREKLETHIWNYDYQGASNMIDVYIRYLRIKIDKDYENKLIHTVRGVGYMIKDKEKNL